MKCGSAAQPTAILFVQKLIKVLVCSALLVIAFSCLLALVWYYFSPHPQIRQEQTYSSAYFDADEQLLRITLANDERYRIHQPLSAMASALVQATILYEDQRFYTHLGVDVTALFRAAWSTYILRSRRIGASTITMQVARLHWDIVSNKPLGKLQQIVRAMQLSRHYTKDDILELYLNLASYGRNIEGVAAASLIYFNKKASELSLPEALALAVIPQNPSKRNPTTVNGLNAILTARKRLFQRWLEHRPLDQTLAVQQDLPLAVRAPEELPFIAPHFINYVAQQQSIGSQGYVHTSLHSSKQASIENILRNYIARQSSLGMHNASALLLNYETMMIEAMVGSADFSNEHIQGQVNAITAKRSPGSTLKPFVYALALDQGLIHPLSLLKDSPRRFGGFTPENYDKQFLGPVSAKTALIESRNVPAVDLQAKLPKQSFYQFLRAAGVSDLQDEAHYGLALALGGGEVTQLELATLYATLANQGILKPITVVTKDTERDRVVEMNEADEVVNQQQPQRILSAEASFLVMDMLKDNSAPNALALPSAAAQKNHVAWKTGTSWAFRDAWAVGISGPYVLLVWVGNFDGKGNSAFVGRTAAGPLLFSLFAAINPAQAWRVEDAFVPESLNLKRLKVCLASGDLYEKHCQSTADTWFIPGVSPIKVSNVYRRIAINKHNGLRACAQRYGVTEMQVFEFWPSDLLQIFNQAGIVLKTPPAYESGCDLTEKAMSGQSPVISSPQTSIEYAISAAQRSRQIPLKAIVDPDVRTTHWFIDDVYIGSAEKGETLLWPAHSGHFQVRVVDDSGRSASQSFVIKFVH